MIDTDPPTESAQPVGQPPPAGSARGKLAAVAILAIIVISLFYFYGGAFNLDNLAKQEEWLRRFQADHPVLVYVLAFLIYVLGTGLSLPGATVMTLVLGWYLKFWRALILVSIASTTGATLAFLLSRYLLRDAIQSRFGERLKTFNEQLDREGAFYLFTLRLIPAVPFFAINLVMGLTRIRVTTFWWVSQLGMLAGTCVYVYAGSTIPSLAQLADPSKLRAEDVTDWPGLVQRLPAGKGSDTSVTSQNLWNLLSDEDRTLIENLATGQSELNDASKSAILAALDDVLENENLTPDLKFDPIERDLAEKELENSRRKRIKQITSHNREAMVAAFDDQIRAPRPILSWQLLAAFATLGLFPIVVKKGLARFRPAAMKDR